MASETTNYYEYVLKNSIEPDFEISLKDKTIQAHKQVLGPQNQVFLEQFTTHPEFNKIEILDVDPQAFKTFIDYLYTGKVSDENITEELFLVAHRYADSNLKNLCREKLGRDLSVENVVGRLLTFLNCEEKRLIKEASVFVANNFNNMKIRPEFKYILETPDAMSAVFDVFEELHIFVLTFNNENPDRQALIESATKSDVTIKVQNHTFLAHKNVLTSRNAVFNRTISASSALSTGISTLNIAEKNNINLDVFKVFLKHIYVGVVSKSAVSIDLMVLAHAYEDTKLKSICEYLLISDINSENAVDYLITGINIEGKLLVDGASKFIAHHFKEMSVRPEFKLVQENTKAVSAIFQKLSNCLETQKRTSFYMNTFEFKVPLIKSGEESEKFYVNNIPLSIGMFQQKCKKDNDLYLSILFLRHDNSVAPHKFEFSFRLTSTVDASHDVSRGPMAHTILSSKHSFGVINFLSWTDLNDPEKGLMKDGNIAVEITVKYLKKSDGR